MKAYLHCEASGPSRYLGGGASSLVIQHANCGDVVAECMRSVNKMPNLAHILAQAQRLNVAQTSLSARDSIYASEIRLSKDVLRSCEGLE
jgi:hypothetical protein